MPQTLWQLRLISHFLEALLKVKLRPMLVPEKKIRACVVGLM